MQEPVELLTIVVLAVTEMGLRGSAASEKSKKTLLMLAASSSKTPARLPRTPPITGELSRSPLEEEEEEEKSETFPRAFNSPRHNQV